ncbi:MAG: hypothetical protein ACU841_02295 [Gammaproteobacteria bacterium]
MPLQQLIEYYNDRFEREHRSSYHPLMLKKGQVTGFFGPIRVGSRFTPIRRLSKPATIIAHAAVCAVTLHDFRHLPRVDHRDAPIEDNGRAPDFETIINLDRLTRTVHMLNYLPLVHLEGNLFLDVDPMHILGVRRDHGAYFEEVIEKCGLTTRNVVISMTVNSVHASHHPQLLSGLNNYRRRGYRIALTIGNPYSGKSVQDLVAGLNPDYVRVCPGKHAPDRHIVPPSLRQLKALLDDTEAETVLKIEQEEQSFIGPLLGFDFVEEGFFNTVSESLLPEETDESVRL